MYCKNQKNFKNHKKGNSYFLKSLKNPEKKSKKFRKKSEKIKEKSVKKI